MENKWHLFLSDNSLKYEVIWQSVAYYPTWNISYIIQ